MSRSQVLQIPFPSSKTCLLLADAFTFSAAAHRLDLLAASACEEAGMSVIAHAFRFTAAQEKEHSAIFSGLMEVYGGDVPRPGDVPSPAALSPAALLTDAMRREDASARDFLPAAAETARAEGYPRIATAFLRIAETELLHARRFSQYAAALQDGSLFRDPSRVGWLCLPCGMLSYGTDAPEICAACGCRNGAIRSSFHPFAVPRIQAGANCNPAATVL